VNQPPDVQKNYQKTADRLQIKHHIEHIRRLIWYAVLGDDPWLVLPACFHGNVRHPK